MPINMSYHPERDDVVVKFYVEGRNIQKIAESIAQESSTGTWTEVTTENKTARDLAATVFSIRKSGRGHELLIVYHRELFEKGNIPQLLSSIAGNIFGMKSISSLRLIDALLPKWYVKSFHGPSYGMKGVRKLVRTLRSKRPHIGTIVKPKMGLSPKETARVAGLAWEGGVDFVKDDENLTSHRFCKFEQRVRLVLKEKQRIEKETGNPKLYAPNVTGPVDTMIRRAEFVRNEGGRVIMIDVITAGFSAVQYMRELFPDMVIHAHRAMHAAITRNPRHGISMLFLAKLLRLAGVDQLHTGTAVGKMEGKALEIRRIIEEIEKSRVDRPLEQEWYSMKPVFAVTSGGLHPGLVPALIRLFGNDIVIQAGGGIHGHPSGTKAGAMAMKQAVEASMQSIPLKEYARTHKELAEALKIWRVVE